MKKTLATIGRARALVRYFRDPAASILGKLFVLGAVVYVICPIDLIPDVPIIGWLDDLGVMGLAVAWMWKVVGRYRVPDGPNASAAPLPSPIERGRLAANAPAAPAGWAPVSPV